MRLLAYLGHGALLLCAVTATRWAMDVSSPRDDWRSFCYALAEVREAIRPALSRLRRTYFPRKSDDIIVWLRKQFAES